MSDEADVANDMAQKHLDVVLDQHEKPNAKSEYCVGCGEYIIEARQVATNGTELCVTCATIEYEKDQREMRRHG